MKQKMWLLGVVLVPWFCGACKRGDEKILEQKSKEHAEVIVRQNARISELEEQLVGEPADFSEKAGKAHAESLSLSVQIGKLEQEISELEKVKRQKEAALAESRAKMPLNNN